MVDAFSSSQPSLLLHSNEQIYTKISHDNKMPISYSLQNIRFEILKNQTLINKKNKSNEVW